MLDHSQAASQINAYNTYWNADTCEVQSENGEL